MVDAREMVVVAVERERRRVWWECGCNHVS
jgi:hypothetical protein